MSNAKHAAAGVRSLKFCEAGCFREQPRPLRIEPSIEGIFDGNLATNYRIRNK